MNDTLSPPPPAVRVFRVVYAILALQFVIPALSYLAAPQLALGTLDQVNRALGGGPYAVQETGQLWHMLAVGNVMTLGFMCALLCADLQRFYPVLPALAFLKGFSALYALAIGVRHALPVFAAIFVLDGATTAAMIFFARAAHRALEPDADRAPLWSWLLLWNPPRILESLRRAQASGLVERAPTLGQVAQGVLRMWKRLLFRSGTIGRSARPVRATWRARLLRFRPLRFPFLLAERAVAPLDFSGLASPPWRVIRHLLGAHHDGVQFLYDLELLSCTPGALEALRDAAREIVSGRSPRAAWLRDLTVYEGYHEDLLAAAEGMLAGKRWPEAESDPDLSLRAYLRWCARA